MTVITEERINLKAGWSSYCQRDEHRTCASAKARCSCPCHGKSGQAPPTPKEQPIAAVVDLPGTNSHGPLRCPDCGKDDFAKPQGLGAHRAHAHGFRRDGSTPKPKASVRGSRSTKPKLDGKSVRESLDDFDPWVLIVGIAADDGMRAESVVLAGEGECRQVSTLLDRLGHKSHAFRLADSR